MFKSFIKIFSNKNNIFLFLFVFILVFFVFRISPDILLYWDIMRSKSFSFEIFWDFFWYKTVLSFGIFLFWDNFIAVAVPFLISINIILFINLYKKQKIFLQGKSFFAAFSGMFFGFFGAGCAACSGILFAPLVSALGLTFVFDILPYRGSELAFLGILILLISSLYILKKINDPMICK